MMPKPNSGVGVPANSDGRLPEFENHADQQVKYTTCYMCACRCGIKVTLENNQIRFIQGNPRHPINQGVLCAKGNAGIMKQISPAKLRTPLLRVAGSERGESRFEPISWDKALDILTERLRSIRETDPKKLAYFTGRDQMQALTGLWAQQFGTINWAAHGGFCSVNMAAAGLYTIGHSFWEFGDPDWERTKYFVLWGVAEDHSSNPIKIGLEKLKRRGVKFVAVNPIRTGYQAIADEWIAPKPGTDGILAMSMCRILIENELFDWEFLIRYTNAPWLIKQKNGCKDDGLVLRDADGVPQVWDQKAETPVSGLVADTHPALFGEYSTPDGVPVKTAFSLFAERCLSDDYKPGRVAEISGVSAETIRRIALEMAHIAFKETIEIKCEWTDWAGRKHDRFVGRPVAMHAMRGISAHSNGFQTCRAIHMLQMLLGSIDCPGGHRAKAPFPRHIPPPIKPAKETAPNTPLSSPPLGFPTGPEDLLIDDSGEPLRIDKAYSWEAPLANHGLLHTVICNAANADPYPIDTLLLFMANLAWNSSMNVGKVREALCAKDENGDYKIPFLAVVDAFNSEMVGFADLVIPDTTYLERNDAISLLDRPISEPDSICDSIRTPVMEIDRDVRSWQDVMVELAGRLQFPAFTDEDGSPKFKDYKDFVIRYEKAPGIGFLAGWRGADGSQPLRGEPNPKQWEAYVENECFFRYRLPENQRYYRFANRDYLDFAHRVGFTATTEPIIMELYSESLQKFRLAAQGHGDTPPPAAGIRDHVARFCDPLPFYYTPLEQKETDAGQYPFYALTQRPMAMYHSWDSQNVWLRQIHASNPLYMNRRQAEKMGIRDHSWVWVESRNGRVRARVKLMEGVREDTVWTWNAIGKQKGAWNLAENADEANQGFLLNHIIDDCLPESANRAKPLKPLSNSDPVTGQAAWFDLRVRVYPAAGDITHTWPLYANKKDAPDTRAGHAGSDNDARTTGASPMRYQSHRAVHLRRALRDILTR